MGNLFHGPTPFIILFVVLLLFGAPKLPALAKSLGQSMKILKKEVATTEEEKLAAEDVAEELAAPPAAVAPAVAAPAAPAVVAAPAAAAEAAVVEPAVDAVSSVENELVKAETEAAAASDEALRTAAEARSEGKSEV